MDAINIELTGVIVDAVAAAGIIVTLLYLVKQTKLHTAQIQADSHQASVGSFVRQLLHVTETAENSRVFRKGLHDFSGRDASTQNAFHSMMIGFISSYNRTWRLYKAGLLDDDEISANQRTLLGILRSPGPRAWWESWKLEPPRDLSSHIDGLLNNAYLETGPWSEKALFRLEDSQ